MDKYGIVTWAEIPQIGPGGYQDQGYINQPSFRENGKEQLKELIRQHYNHPSICFWGLFNELKTIGDNPTEYIEELNDLAHQEDPTRLTTSASFLSYDDDINKVTDVIAWNQYFDWYGGSPSDMRKWLDANHKAHPEYKIAISEYGAGASIYHQQDSVKRGLLPVGGIRRITRLIIISETGKHWRNVRSSGVLSFGTCLTSVRLIVWKAIVPVSTTKGW